MTVTAVLLGAFASLFRTLTTNPTAEVTNDAPAGPNGCLTDDVHDDACMTAAQPKSGLEECCKACSLPTPRETTASPEPASPSAIAPLGHAPRASAAHQHHRSLSQSKAQAAAAGGGSRPSRPKLPKLPPSERRFRAHSSKSSKGATFFGDGRGSLKQPRGLSACVIQEDSVYPPANAEVTLEVHEAIVRHGRKVLRYSASRAVDTIYVKIPNADPSRLPPALLEGISRTIEVGLQRIVVGAAIRPGCALVAIDLLSVTGKDHGASGTEPRADGASWIELLEQHAAGDGAALLRDGTAQQELGRQLSAWLQCMGVMLGAGAQLQLQYKGALITATCMDASAGTWSIKAVRPPAAPHAPAAAATPASEGGAAPVPPPVAAQLFLAQQVLVSPASASDLVHVCGALSRAAEAGDHEAEPPTFILQATGRYLPVTATRTATAGTSGGSAAGADWPVQEPGGCADHAQGGAASCQGAAVPYQLSLPGLAHLTPHSAALLQLEVWAGHLLLCCRPLLALPGGRAELAAQVESLLQAVAESERAMDGGASAGADGSRSSTASVDALVEDLGFWLEFVGEYGAAVAGLRQPAAANDEGGNPSAASAGGTGAPPAVRAAAAQLATGVVTAAGSAVQQRLVAGPPPLIPGSLDLYSEVQELRQASEPFSETMLRRGLGLLELAAAHGTVLVFREVMKGFLSLGYSYGDALQAVAAGDAEGGTTLLHVAAASGSMEMLLEVVRCATQARTQAAPGGGGGGSSSEQAAGPSEAWHQLPWWRIPAADGQTPLHVAAACMPQRAQEWAQQAGADALQAWERCRMQHGLTPAQLARAALSKAAERTERAAGVGSSTSPSPPPLEGTPAASARPEGAAGRPRTAAGRNGLPKDDHDTPSASDTALQACSSQCSAHHPQAAARAPPAAGAGGAQLQLLRACLVGFGGEVERKYQSWLAQRTVRLATCWSCLHLMLLSAAVARLLREGRPQDVTAAVLYSSAYACTAVMLFWRPSFYHKHHTAVWVGCGVARASAKLPQIWGWVPTPPSTLQFVKAGVTIITDTMLPGLFEQVPFFVSLALRAWDVLVTAFFMVHIGYTPTLAAGFAKAAFKNSLNIILNTCMEAHFRFMFMRAGAQAKTA